MDNYFAAEAFKKWMTYINIPKAVGAFFFFKTENGLTRYPISSGTLCMWLVPTTRIPPTISLSKYGLFNETGQDSSSLSVKV